MLTIDTLFFFKAIELAGQLSNFSESDNIVLVDWMLTNKVTLDTLATYADPAMEARNQSLPQGPFVALVRKVKEMRASDDVKKVRPHFCPSPPSLRLTDH